MSETNSVLVVGGAGTLRPVYVTSAPIPSQTTSLVTPPTMIGVLRCGVGMSPCVATWTSAQSTRRILCSSAAASCFCHSGPHKLTNPHFRLSCAGWEGNYTAAHYWWDIMRGENVAQPAILVESISLYLCADV